MRVIGTAGHVDHGKSTLVRALTGIDPDRLKEEKARGMTIDLGFAWIDLPAPAAPGNDGDTGRTDSVGIVDVPGHIDFIKNMLAGIGGIDAAILVIAADEGVMPQTREHLAILDLLAVPAAVVALTKIDLADDDDWLDLVELDIVELLQSTHLAEAPIVRVSAMTGDGLPQLRTALTNVLGRLSPRRNRARPRLPIDRIFSLSGFGTVVTGTLSDGHFTVGDAVEILPAGRDARIRGLQTHRKQIWQSEPGSRLAMNLTGVGTDETRRGDVVVKPGTLRATTLIDVSFRLLTDVAKPLVDNQPVDLFVGAGETTGRVRLLGTDELQPGEQGWLQLRLDRPIVVAAGDRFILRQPSPSSTLGGGVVLSPHPRRRWKRFDPAVIARLETLAQGTPDEILLQALGRNPFVNATALIGLSGLDIDVAQRALEELRNAGAVVELESGGPATLVTVAVYEQQCRQILQLLGDFHEANPLRRGMPRGEVRSRLEGLSGGIKFPVRLFNALIARGEQTALWAADDSFIWQQEFAVSLTLHQQAMIDELLAAFAAAPYAPPSAADAIAMLSDDEALLEMLIEEGQLVRVSGGVLFRRDDFAAVTTAVQDQIRTNGAITLAETRDLFGTSRKYAQAILEELDARRVTRRDGDARVLRGGIPTN